MLKNLCLSVKSVSYYSFSDKLLETTKVKNLTRLGQISNNSDMKSLQQISFPQKELNNFCRQHHIRKLAFFGSVLSDKFGPESDIDVLIEFEPEHIPGLVDFISMEMALTEILGRKVDLNTPQSLSHYFRDRVIAEAKVQYAA